MNIGQRVWVHNAQRRTPYGYKNLRHVGATGTVLQHWHPGEEDEIIDIVLDPDQGGVVVSAHLDQLQMLEDTTHPEEHHVISFPA